MTMQWKVLALILRARANMKALLDKVYKSKEKMKLYCFLFPSDYEFERDTLIQLWIAMGFSEQRCAENFSKRYFDVLVKEEYISFLRVDILSGKTMYKVDQHKVKLLSDGKTHTMEIRGNNHTFLEYDETNIVGSKKSCHVSLVSNDINQVSFKELTYGGLKTLLFLRNYGSSLEQIPSNMFFTLELVQALDLSGSHITELPISIRNLSHLRYLDLSFTLIECLPESIYRLCQLQTLKLQGCRHLYELPKGMKELIGLHHLEFDVLDQLSFLPKGIGALTEIQTLSAFIVNSKEGCDITELKGMNNLRGRCCISGLENVSSSDAHEAFLQGKKHLTHLQLRWNNLKLYSIEDQHEAYNIIANLELNNGLEELQITCYPALELPAWVNFKEQVNLVHITLFKCENRVVALPLGKLPNLKDLIIIRMNRVTKIDKLVRGGYEEYAAFPRLERLEIVCLSSIESWMDVFPDDFPLLSKLIIKHCPELNSLAFIPHLHSLEHLEISHCSAFKCLPDGTLPTNLKTFIVHDCPTLEISCSKNGTDWEKIKHVQEIWIDYENIRCFHEDIVDGGDKDKKSSTSEDISCSEPLLVDVGNSSTAEDKICSASVADDQSSTAGCDLDPDFQICKRKCPNSQRIIGAIVLAADLAQTVFTALQTQELKDFCSMFDCATQIQKLENTMSTVKAFFGDFDAKGQELISNTSQDLIEKLKDAVYDVDDFLDEFRTVAQLHRHTQQDAKLGKKVGNFFSRHNKYLFAFKVSREIEMLRKKLDKITRVHKDYGFNPVVSTDVTKLVAREETSAAVSELEVIGRKDDMEIIVGMLLPPDDGPHYSDKKVSFVNIVGVGGLGKTTLAQLVYNDKRVIETFSERIWVCVSDVEFSPKEILQKIVEEEVFDLNDAHKRVRKLLKGKRYLLVLDDVWNEDYEKWRDLKSFLFFDEPGSKVIVTSRSKKVAKSIGDDSIMHELTGLSEENSWNLFEMIAFGKQREDHRDDPDLVNIGTEIVKKCANVPLSIRVIASLLHGQRKIEWERFRSNDLVDMSDEYDENSIMWTLMFSYYHLTPKLKSCFSFCSLFPKDHIIKKELLINLWLAQGYLADATNNSKSFEEVGEDYLTLLSNRCFFQDIKRDEHGDVYSFKMHDLMHDLALEVVGMESLIITPAPKNQQLGKRTRHISTRERGSSNLCLSNTLRTFIWLGDDSPLSGYAKDSSSDEVTQIVSKCKRLRVLSLPKFGIGHTFPNKVGRLLHLRYLDLTNNRLEMLPKSITKLHNLQTLILRKCRHLKELPKDMCKLINLRTLNTKGCTNLKELPEDISKLVNLRTLAISDCIKLKELPEDMRKLVNLRTLDISYCHKLTYIPRGMNNLTNLQRLSDFIVGGIDEKQIKGSKLKDLHDVIRNLKGNLNIRVLNFSSHNMPRDTNRGFILKNARLKSLSIRCGSPCDNENEFDQSEVHETLVEDLCPNEDICKISIEGYRGTKMPSWAASLMEYTGMNGLQHVTSLSRFRCLKELCLWNLPNVEYIMEIENDGAWESRTLFFPVLEKLVLRRMPKLKGWWRGLRWREMEGVAGGCLVDDSGLENAVALPCFPQLCVLRIGDCKSMTYFPPCPHVKQMELFEVNEALTFCMKGGASSCSMSTSSSGLEKLVIDNARVMNRVLLSECAEGGVINIALFGDEEVKNMGTLREVFEKVGCTLNNLSISSCKELDIEEEEEEGMPWKHLESLSSLFLRRLPKMVKLPKGLCYLTSLQSLQIVDCENIEEVGECIGSLTSLQSLTLCDCYKLIALPECIGFLTSLKSLEIISKQLESLPESMHHLTSLYTLVIYEANDKLRERCREPDGEYWPWISRIPDLHISPPYY